MTAARYYTSTALPTILSAALGASGNPEVPSLPGIWPTSYPFPVLIDWGLPTQEAILVTSAPTGSGPLTLPCTRGEDGTTAQSHAAGAIVVHGTTSYEPTLLQTLDSGGGGAVSSVFGRTGAVTATSGDYTVSEVTGAAPLASGTQAAGSVPVSTGAGATSDFRQPFGLLYVDAFGADPTGGSDSTAAFVAAQAAGGSGKYLLVMGPGSYVVGTSENIGTFGTGQGLIGPGSAHCSITYAGSGTCIAAYESTFNDSNLGGRFGGFTLSGYGAGSGAVGMSWGNLQSARSHDIAIYGFPGVGLQLENGAGAWSEEAEWTGIRLIQNGVNVLFSGGSFDYSVYEFLIVANSGQDGIRMQNAAQLLGCRLGLRGNFAAGAGNTAAVIAIDRGNSSGTSYIANLDADICVECDGSSGTGHYTILLGSSNSASSFSGTGVLSFINQTVSFQGVSNANFLPFGFSGVINDTVLGSMTAGDSLATYGGQDFHQNGSFTSTSASLYFNFADIFARKLVSGNTTLTFNAFSTSWAKRIDLFLAQPSSGAAGTVTWPGSVVWAGGSAPVLQTANSAIDHLRFVYLPSANAWYGELIGVAGGLATATTTVAISAATAPASGQVLTATSSTAADWQPAPTGTVSVVATATGTSGTDETNIGNAITAAGTGGTVYFPQGTYSAANLSPANGQTWYGPAVIKLPAGTAASVIAATGVTGWTMQGLTIDGNISGTATYQPAVSLTNCTGCVLDTVTVQNTPSPSPGVGPPGIQLRGTVHCRVVNCLLTNVSYGILVGMNYGDWGSPNNYVCYGNVITGTVIDGTTNDAVFITENFASLTGSGQTVTGTVVGTVMSGCTVRNCGDSGVEIGSGSVYTEVSGCTFVGISNAEGNNGILFRDAIHGNATACTVSNYTKSSSCGVLMYNLNANNVHCSITDINVRNCQNGYVITGTSDGSTPVTDYPATDIAVSGGVIEGVTAFGMWLINVSGFSITGTQVYDSAANGIQLGTYETSGSSCTDGTITGARVLNSSYGDAGAYQSGIVLLEATAGITISGCRVGDNQESPTQNYGVQIYSTSVTNVTIDGNDLRGNVSAGIYNYPGTPPIRVFRNLGYNPLGVTSVTPGSSPWTYTAGITPEVLYLAGATVSGVTKDSTAIPYNSGGIAYALEPDESVTVTYTGTFSSHVTDRK